MNNLNLIIGTNPEQIDLYINNILSKIEYLSENKITYDLSIDTLSSVLDEASMMSLFSDIKVIIGNNFDLNKLNDNDIDYLNRYVKNINKDAYIILIASSIDQRKSSYKIFKEYFKIIDTVKLDSRDDLYKYVNNIIKEKGYKLSDINYFLDKVGNNISNINNELAKLMTYKEEDKNITNNDINLLITDNIDTVIYEFTNAILEDNTDNVVKMYHNFKLENISFDYILVSIANTFRQALIIKLLANDNKSNSEIAKVIGKKEFYVKKMLERIYRYTADDLCKYINKLAKIDYDFKTGVVDESALELFLIDKDK